MQVTIGKEGLTKTWQGEFPGTTLCIHPGCDGEARIAFVGHEGLSDGDKEGPFVYGLHPNSPGDKDKGYWLHDCCAVAVYFCKECLNPTALYNQG